MTRYRDLTGVERPEILGSLAEATLAAHADALVHFWAEWNTHDRTMARRLSTISGRLSRRVALFACDIDGEGNAEFCRACGVANVPALTYFHHGVPGPTCVGLRPPDDLVVWIEEQASRRGGTVGHG